MIRAAVKAAPEKEPETPQKPEKKEAAPAPVKEAPKKEAVKKETERKSAPRQAETARRSEPREEREVVQRTDEEIAQIKATALEFLSGVFKAMELPVEIQMEYNAENGSLEVDFAGEDMGILIGKRGQTLDSLQYLTSLVVNKEQKDYVRVKLDTENYRKRRKETLENLARNIAYKVKKTRRPVSLEPMNPYERRIIHSALQGNKFVETLPTAARQKAHAVISRLSTILEDNSLPLYLSQLLLKLQQHYHYLVEQIKDLESQLKRKLDEDEVGQRLLSIPCVGTLTASTISTEIGDGKQYASSRDFAAATGLVPRQYSTGGRTTLLGISKRGNKKIRTLLVQCARVFIQKLEHQSGKLADWVRDLLCRKSNFVVTCALANKLARIAWALTARQQTYVA